MFILRGNACTFGVAGVGRARVSRGNSHSLWHFNLFDVDFSLYFSYFSLVRDGLDRVLRGNYFSALQLLSCAFFVVIGIRIIVIL